MPKIKGEVTCETCGGGGEVHSHNPKCWDCNGIGYRVNGVEWICPIGDNDYVCRAFAVWKETGRLWRTQARKTRKAVQHD